MIPKKYRSRIVLASTLSLILMSAIPGQSETAQIPYYSSKSQADSGYMAALHESDMTSGQLQNQMEKVRESETHLHNMQANGTETQVHMAEKEHHQVESMLTSTMSQMSGIAESDIEAMRETGMSWGQMASEIGLQSHGGNASGAADHNSMATATTYNRSMDQNDHQVIANMSESYHNRENTQGHGVGMAEMDAATSRDMINGGVSGHGTSVDSSIDHEPGAMMGGAGGLSGDMSAGSGMGGGVGSGGMGGSSGGGMGSSGGGMGGTGGTGGTGSSGGGMGGSSGGSSGGHGGGSGGGGMM